MEFKENMYPCKDGRQRVFYVDGDGKKHTISYPRLIMEEYLGRELESYEEVHHKDFDPTNNNIDNLVVMAKSEHRKIHKLKYRDSVVTCEYCGAEFIWSASAQSQFYRSQKRKDRQRSGKLFCSKQCSGKYGRSIQIADGKINLRSVNK